MMDVELDKAFQERLSTVVGENVSAFARRIGMSPQRLHNYVSGANKPPLAVLVKIVRECGANAHWLLTGQGSPGEPSATIAGPPEAADLGKIPAAQLVAEINRRVALAMGIAAEASAVSQEMLQQLDKLLRADDEKREEAEDDEQT